jgi:hypothetical protein
MSHATYEIRLRGPLPPGLMPRLPGARCTEAGGETVLLTPSLDQGRVHQVIAALRDLGLELLELRRAPTPSSSRRSPDET